MKDAQPYLDGVIARIFISSMAAWPTTWACAACSTRCRFSKPCTMPASQRRSITCAGSLSSSSIRCPHLPPSGINRRLLLETVDILLKATGVPIDHYSYEAVELLKDISARWEALRKVRNLAGCSTNKDSPICVAVRVPEARNLRHRRVVCRAPGRGGAPLLK